jgi:site-specific DNA-cytosine methylase
MKVLSVFDGGAMAYHALLLAGYNPISIQYYSSEVDKYAKAVSKARVPNLVQLGDVRLVSGHRFRDFDLLIGGSPCTNLSIAGNGKGLKGTESQLFWEYVRIWKEGNFEYFLLENVASMKNSDRDIISETLGCQPIPIDSALVSGQTRKRYYWTNIPNVTQPDDLDVSLFDILESDVDDKYYVNDERVKWYADRIVSATASHPIRVGTVNKGGMGERIYHPTGKSVALMANGGGRGAKTGLYMEFVDREKSYCLDANYFKGGNMNSYFKSSRRQVVFRVNDHSYVTYRKLTPTECERLQTLPDGWTDVGISDTQRYKICGNGFTTRVLAHILKGMR